MFIEVIGQERKKKLCETVTIVYTSAARDKIKIRGRAKMRKDYFLTGGRLSGSSSSPRLRGFGVVAGDGDTVSVGVVVDFSSFGVDGASAGVGGSGFVVLADEVSVGKGAVVAGTFDSSAPVAGEETGWGAAATVTGGVDGVVIKPGEDGEGFDGVSVMTCVSVGVPEGGDPWSFCCNSKTCFFNFSFLFVVIECIAFIRPIST